MIHDVSEASTGVDFWARWIGSQLPKAHQQPTWSTGMEKEYIKEDDLSLNRFNYDFVINSIAGIELAEGKIIEDFTEEELIKFVDSLVPSEFQKLSDGIISKVSEFSLSKKVSCPLCKNESEVVYDELFSLMVFS